MWPLIVILFLNEIPENISRDRRGDLICLHMGPVDAPMIQDLKLCDQ